MEIHSHQFQNTSFGINAQPYSTLKLRAPLAFQVGNYFTSSPQTVALTHSQRPPQTTESPSGIYQTGGLQMEMDFP